MSGPMIPGPMIPGPLIPQFMQGQMMPQFMANSQYITNTRNGQIKIGLPMFGTNNGNNIHVVVP